MRHEWSYLFMSHVYLGSELLVACVVHSGVEKGIKDLTEVT